MNRVLLASLTALIFVVAAPIYPAGDVKFQDTEVGKSHMEFACPARPHLRLHVRSGEIRIIGTDDSKISVDLTGKNADKIQDVKAQLTCSNNAAELNVSGGPTSEILTTIRVPKNVDLYARIPAGEVTIEDVTGNKDVELHAGELTIYVGSASDYGHVDASVLVGNVNAEIFGGSKGGLFRNVSKDAAGKYYLHAHVGTGELALRENF